jgi:hypothetical protein
MAGITRITKRYLRRLFSGLHFLPTKKRNRKKLALVLAAAALGGFLAYLPQLGLSRQSRLTVWTEEAITAYSAGDFELTKQLIEAARKLDPEDRNLILMEARTALRLELPHTLELWQPLLTGSRATAEDLGMLASYLSDTGQYDELNRVLPLLIELNPTGVRARELYLESLVRSFQFDKVEQVARRWISEGATNWFIHKALCEALLLDSNPNKNREGYAHLENLATKSDENGIEAARLLTRVTADPAKKAIYIRQLERQSGLKPMDKIYIATWQYHVGGSISFKEADQRILEIINPTESDQLKFYISWLSEVERYDKVLIQLTHTEAQQDPLLNQIYFEALIRQNQPEEILDLTREPYVNSLALNEVYIRLYRARAFKALDQEKEFKEALEWAMVLSTEQEIRLLESELKRLGMQDALEVYYWRLMNNSQHASYAAPRLLNLIYEKRDEVDLVNALEMIDFEMVGENPSTRLFLAYLNLLYLPGRSLETMHEVENIVADFPGFVESYLILALGHHLYGRKESVDRFNVALPKTVPADRYRHLQVAYFAIDGDSQPPSELNLSKLLPREWALLTALKPQQS